MQPYLETRLIVEKWLYHELIDVIGSLCGPQGTSEEDIYWETIDIRGKDNRAWQSVLRLERVLLIWNVLESLIKDDRICVVSTQATGRRYFRLNNVLDIIAEHLQEGSGIDHLHDR